MPREVRDEYSGALLFVPTEDEQGQQDVERVLLALVDALPAAKQRALPDEVTAAVERLRARHGE